MKDRISVCRIKICSKVSEEGLVESSKVSEEELVESSKVSEEGLVERDLLM